MPSDHSKGEGDTTSVPRGKRGAPQIVARNDDVAAKPDNQKDQDAHVGTPATNESPHHQQPLPPFVCGILFPSQLLSQHD